MSITLDNSDFQCLQDQLLDLKSKNYELAEKTRRSQADFEAAKAKICSLQLKLEEQERDFQVTTTTLRREIEAVTVTEPNKENKDEDYKAKYKKLLPKAKELQQRYEKSLEVMQQLESQNKSLIEKVKTTDEENEQLKHLTSTKQKELDMIEQEIKEKLNGSIDEYISQVSDEKLKIISLTEERNSLNAEVERLTSEVNNFDSRLENQAEERKIHEKKGLQIVRELKRQLALEKSHSETLQKRLENLLTATPSDADIENRSRLSLSSSTNGNSSNGNGSQVNQDTNSVGSWSFVPIKDKDGDAVLVEALRSYSEDSEGRETVQRPCDTISENSLLFVTREERSKANLSTSTTTDSLGKQTSSSERTYEEDQKHGSLSASNVQRQSSSDGLLIEEQAALVERLTKLQHDKWMLEEKLSYLEQANLSLSEDVANKSDIIKHYFMEQAARGHNSETGGNSEGSFGNFNMHSILTTRRTSFPNSVGQMISEKPSFKKVLDFLKERNQASGESESISKEATKKMQLMLEETLIKCMKLQENLDHLTMKFNKVEG